MKCFQLEVGSPTAVMDVYLRDKAYEFVDHSRRPCVLICPGGGYGFVSHREGESIAVAFVQAGYQVCILRYAVREKETDGFLGDIPLQQAAAALSAIRTNAEAWGIHPEKISVLGCSAGAHLAGSLGVFSGSEARIPGSSDGLCRPNAMLLCYPVVTAGEFCHDSSIYNLCGLPQGDPGRDAYSLEKHVSGSTCPAFIWHTVNDELVPVENALLLAGAMQQHKRPYELHLYTHGQHGLATATAAAGQGTLINDHVATWIPLAQQWLNSMGLGPGY